LHTILQRKTPEGLVDRLEINLKPASNITDLLGKLEVDMDTDAMLLVVNGRIADPSQRLSEGDQVNLMPAISGGCLFWQSKIETSKTRARFHLNLTPMGLHDASGDG